MGSGPCRVRCNRGSGLVWGRFETAIRWWFYAFQSSRFVSTPTGFEIQMEATIKHRIMEALTPLDLHNLNWGWFKRSSAACSKHKRWPKLTSMLKIGCGNYNEHCGLISTMSTANQYKCPYPECKQTFGTTSGIRKHWLSSTGHGDTVPKLVASELMVVSIPASPAISDASVSDATLVNMMGLSEGQVDTRSAGRFARASLLANQAPVHVPKVEGCNEWKDVVAAFFASSSDDISRCSVHSKLVLSESGKVFAAVNAATENYR